MIAKERRKKIKAVASTFQEPAGLFGYDDDKLGQFWSLKSDSSKFIK